MTPQWSQVSEFVEERTGLHFPPERHADLRRAVAAAAQELGMADAEECARWLLASRPAAIQIRTLISRLTVGETYFFRDSATFQAVADQVLPDLLRRHADDRQLRIWSAGCCTGEEAYSIAILLHEHLPAECADWRITLLGTDLNEDFLRKAATAEYGQWSFREENSRLRERYFTRTRSGRFLLNPEIRRMVQLAPMNLVTDELQANPRDMQEMDLIFCRNVLMYFTPEQAGRVVRKLHAALGSNGWLVVSPGESWPKMFGQFAPVCLPGGTFYRKPGPARAGSGAPAPSHAPNGTSVSRATMPVNSGSREAWPGQGAPDPVAFYFRAMALKELCENDRARQFLQRAIALDPGFVPAHVALGNLARADGDAAYAKRHFGLALHLLETRNQDESLPESGARAARRLREILAAIRAGEVCR